MNLIKKEMEEAIENQKIYEEIISERRRFLISSYTMKG
jgi:hypothetical protein